MVTSRFLSKIPYPEDEAISQAPITWQLRTDYGNVIFKIPLFSFTKYHVFNKVTQAIKFLLADGKEVSLRTLLELDTYAVKSEDEKQSNYILMIKEALYKFHEMYGILPFDLADLLAIISEPLNVNDFYQVIHRYNKAKDMWDIKKRTPKLTKFFMKEVFQNELDISDCIKLLLDIQKVNIEVKKKLLVDNQVQETKLSPKQRQSRYLQQKRLKLAQKKPSQNIL